MQKPIHSPSKRERVKYFFELLAVTGVLYCFRSALLGVPLWPFSSEDIDVVAVIFLVGLIGGFSSRLDEMGQMLIGGLLFLLARIYLGDLGGMFMGGLFFGFLFHVIPPKTRIHPGRFFFGGGLLIFLTLGIIFGLLSVLFGMSDLGTGSRAILGVAEALIMAVCFGVGGWLGTLMSPSALAFYNSCVDTVALLLVDLGLLRRESKLKKTTVWRLTLGFISMYVLIALCFGVLYANLVDTWPQYQFFNVQDPQLVKSVEPLILGKLLYFSVVTVGLAGSVEMYPTMPVTWILVGVENLVGLAWTVVGFGLLSHHIGMMLKRPAS